MFSFSMSTFYTQKYHLASAFYKPSVNIGVKILNNNGLKFPSFHG